MRPLDSRLICVGAPKRAHTKRTVRWVAKAVSARSDSDAERAAVGKPLHPDAAFGSVDAPPHPTRVAVANTNAIERLTGAASQPLG
jgi:hypothetical protein